MHARFEVIRRNPAVVRISVPEQMAVGGRDDGDAIAGLDGEVVEIGVVMAQDDGDGLRLVLSGLGVVRLNSVAKVEGGDLGGLPVREQDRRRSGERLPARRRPARTTGDEW